MRYAFWVDRGGTFTDCIKHDRTLGTLEVFGEAADRLADMSERFRPEAMAATDLAISRAGAMATAELLAWGIPAILIPLPTAAAICEGSGNCTRMPCTLLSALSCSISLSRSACEVSAGSLWSKDFIPASVTAFDLDFT